MTSHEIRYLNFLYLFVLAKLTDRQISIMMARFICRESFREIAQDHKVSHQACRYAVKQACGKMLRSPKVRNILKSHMTNV